ncbi:MAG: hypothetical protein NTZ02_01055 [Candidatus Woesearchaeota archaeon]|nr:hypothetical protein [Candidatus Woesearchaeota archaeon]
MFLAIIAAAIIFSGWAGAAEVSISSVNEIVALNKFIQKNITVSNDAIVWINVTVIPEGNISRLVDFSPGRFDIKAKDSRSFILTIYGNEEPLKFINNSYFI